MKKTKMNIAMLYQFIYTAMTLTAAPTCLLRARIALCGWRGGAG